MYGELFVNCVHFSWIVTYLWIVCIFRKLLRIVFHSRPYASFFAGCFLRAYIIVSSFLSFYCTFFVNCECMVNYLWIVSIFRKLLRIVLHWRPYASFSRDSSLDCEVNRELSSCVYNSVSSFLSSFYCAFFVNCEWMVNYLWIVSICEVIR
jgi:hypothetical protein